MYVSEESILVRMFESFKGDLRPAQVGAFIMEVNGTNNWWTATFKEGRGDARK